MGGRQRRHQLGARQRVGGGAGEEPPAEYRPRALKLGRPLRIEARRAGLAGDDLALQRGGPGAGRRPPGRELEHARGRGAGGRAAGSGDQRPDVGRLAQIVRRDVPEQQGVEDALPGEAAQVAREHRVGHFEPGRGGGEPRPEDEAVALVGEVVRERERLLGEPGQPVADLRGERGEERETDRHVRDHRRGERGIQPVDDTHGGLGHDQRAPDGDEEQDPLGVVLPRAAEGRPEQHPAEPGDTGELGQRHIGVAAGDRGDRVQQVDQVGAAAEGEELVHGAAPLPVLPRPGRRAAAREGERGAQIRRERARELGLDEAQLLDHG